MAGNPLVQQGALNRILASVVISNYPQLNVTAPYLGRGGVSLTLEGESTLIIPAMTGTVQSQEPYMMVSLTMNLLKTQALAAAYQNQMVTSSDMGTVTVRPDSVQLGNYILINCAIESVRELSFNGTDAGYVVTIKGYYTINNALWQN